MKNIMQLLQLKYEMKGLLNMIPVFKNTYVHMCVHRKKE